MSETPHTPPPATPWWSQPGGTAVLPPPPPPVAPDPAPVTSRPRRPRTAALLALALVAGGAVGGGVATLLAEDRPAVVAGTTALDTRSLGAVVKGTPESAAAVIAPSVVTVQVTSQVGDVFGNVQRAASSGSGVIIRSEGYVLTNNHVVASAVSGGSVHVTLTDGRTVPATIVGTDPTSDLAVLRLTDATGLTAATFAKSGDMRVGQAVLAVGAPLGLANTVTQGIVSTLHRPMRTGENQLAVIDAVQTDAAINPGNSGGALVDLAGRVVGINTAIATAGGSNGNIGVGFAIPSETATRIADQIIKTGRATHSQIGVSVADAPSGTNGAPGLGALIRSLSPGLPASKAGLQSGDVVTRVGERRVTDADSLIVAIRAHEPGTTVTLTITRGGAEKTIRVTLASSSS